MHRRHGKDNSLRLQVPSSPQKNLIKIDHMGFTPMHAKTFITAHAHTQTTRSNDRPWASHWRTLRTDRDPATDNSRPKFSLSSMKPESMHEWWTPFKHSAKLTIVSRSTEWTKRISDCVFLRTTGDWLPTARAKTATTMARPVWRERQGRINSALV